MYEPSRRIDAFFIAGFQHWDGALVLNDLKPGMPVDLIAESENPYDPEAVALIYQGVKLGYVPASQNSLLSLLAFYGHAEILEARILQVKSDADPWEQVRIGVFVKDAREL